MQLDFAAFAFVFFGTIGIAAGVSLSPGLQELRSAPISGLLRVALWGTVFALMLAIEERFRTFPIIAGVASVVLITIAVRLWLLPRLSAQYGAEPVGNTALGLTLMALGLGMAAFDWIRLKERDSAQLQNSFVVDLFLVSIGLTLVGRAVYMLLHGRDRD